MTAPDRRTFLNPPNLEDDRPLPAETARALDEAARALRKALVLLRESTEHTGLEAAYSAAIENEFDPRRVSTHAQALWSYLRTPGGEEHMLSMHALLMTGQPHAQPGMYRTVGVSVGRYRAPPPGDVPTLMEKLWAYCRTEGLDPVVQSAWTHLVFETIHPFADGNGRTGRALVSRLLGGPLPLSRWIMERRHQYYRLLDSGSGTEWLEWFARGVREESERVLKEAG